MISERKKKESEFRKQIILQAAEQIFGRKPYEEVSIADISKKSGVCIQSIYNLFDSKKELYKNLIFFRISKFTKSLDSALKEKTNPLILLKRWTEVFLKEMADFPQFFPLFLKEKLHYDWGIESQLLFEVRTVFEKEEKRLANLLKKAQKERHIKDAPLHYIKSVFFSYVQAKLDYCFKQKKCLEVNQCVEEIFDDFLNGLKY